MEVEMRLHTLILCMIVLKADFSVGDQSNGGIFTYKKRNFHQNKCNILEQNVTLVYKHRSLL